MSMPGDLDNDRITFNEFNPRALVHSTQHGQGSWLKSPRYIATGLTTLILLNYPLLPPPVLFPTLSTANLLHLMLKMTSTLKVRQNLLLIFSNFQPCLLKIQCRSILTIII